ncbi:MAG: NAD(P)/FAD-dependent oxidoreductase [Verrucomicrobiales bacterium]
MPLHTIELIVKPEDEHKPAAHHRAAAKKLRCHPREITGLRILKSSLDARKRPVIYRLQALVAVGEALPPEEPYAPSYPSLTPDSQKIIIVGAGPAGLFAALRCLELGHQPVLLERGKDASARRFDLAPILRQGTVIEDSNYCFGEGGAGTYSDGKLYTRATKRGPVHDIYRTLVAHGAPPEILVEAHPHIGSNLLPKVVMAIRQTILDHGGEVHFQTKVTGLLRENGRLHGVSTADGRQFTGKKVILATGHSARDIYLLLHREGLRLEAKPFAIGVRIEHPQPLIDRTQYHLRSEEKRPDSLPAARYRLATKIENRGVHSFCMCPGGFIVPAATENDELVVNGMSLSRRDSPFANSGMVVHIEPEDLPGLLKSLPCVPSAAESSPQSGKDVPSMSTVQRASSPLTSQSERRSEQGVQAFDQLPGIQLQKRIEHLAKLAGGNASHHGQIAPAQRAVDFLARRSSDSLSDTSYFPGLHPARLDQVLPQALAKRLALGLKKFGRQFSHYLGPEALLIGFETRTSSPLRIPRDEESLQHPDLPGLIPCAEGAGYAGGIVSAALDGLRCAEAALKD